MANTLISGNASNSQLNLYGTYWLNENDGAVVYVNGSGQLHTQFTEDGGATWPSAMSNPGLNAIITDITVLRMSVWYDKETPNDTGDTLHIVLMETATDTVRYVSIDFASKTYSTPVTIASGLSVDLNSDDLRCSITKTRGGNLLVAFNTDIEHAVYRSTDNGATWSSRASVFENSTSYDDAVLFPANTADANDVIALYFDEASTTDMSVKMYDDSANTWTETSLGATLNVMGADNYYINHDGAIRHSDGKLIVAFHNYPDNSTDDIHAFEINPNSIASPTITQLTDVMTNVSESKLARVAIDQTTDTLYVAYARSPSSSWGLGSTGVYYKSSTDGGSTWSSEVAYHGGLEDWRNIGTGRSVGSTGGKIQFVIFDDDIGDIFVNLDNDVAIAASGGTTTEVIQKNLQYAIADSASITKALQYRINTTPNAIAKSASYSILSTTDPITKSLQYATQNTPAAITKSLQYKVLDTPSAITKSLQYYVNEVATITKQLSYRIIDATAISKTLKYTIITAPSAITKTLDYQLGNYTTITKNLQYRVLTNDPITKSLRYSVAFDSVLTKTLSYSVAKANAITKSLQYAVNDGLAITKSLQYSILSVPSAVTKSLKYTIISSGTAITKSLSYSIPGASLITKSLKYTTVSSAAAVTKSLAYKIATTPTAITKTLQYKVVAPISAITKSLSYNLFVNTTLSTEQWNVNFAPTVVYTKSLQYIVRAEIAITKSLQYRIEASQAITKALTYRIFYESTITKSLVYRIANDTSITKLLAYAVLGENVVSKALTYRVIADQAITKNLAYRLALGSVAITKSLRYSIDQTIRPTVPLVLDVDDMALRLEQVEDNIILM